MAKNESTAVNELIHRVATMTPLRPDPADDLMFRAPPPPLPRTRSAHGTTVGAKTMQGLGPAVKTAVAAAAPKAPPAPPPPSFGRAKPGSMTTGHAVVSAAPVVLEAPSRAWREPAPERREQAPHREAREAREAREVREAREAREAREEWVGTLYVRRPGWQVAVRKLVVPLVAVTVLGAVAGGYFALHAEGGERRASEASSAPVVAAAPAAAAPAAKTAAPTAAPAAKTAAPASTPTSFVDVMIVSSPAGATVTLVDRGSTLLIGTTPISTALDPSRTYELLFSHPGRPAWVEPIDPSRTRRVDVSLGPASKAETKLAPMAREPAGRAPAIREPAAARPALEAPPAEQAVAAPAGAGVLMISSKPPCEIVIDGKPTGLTTPQREIPLPAGAHKVTLVNKAERIHKTISVQITADQPTKVIQDLMK